MKQGCKRNSQWQKITKSWCTPSMLICLTKGQLALSPDGRRLTEEEMLAELIQLIAANNFWADQKPNEHTLDCLKRNCHQCHTGADGNGLNSEAYCKHDIPYHAGSATCQLSMSPSGQIKSEFLAVISFGNGPGRCVPRKVDVDDKVNFTSLLTACICGPWHTLDGTLAIPFQDPNVANVVTENNDQQQCNRMGTAPLSSLD